MVRRVEQTVMEPAVMVVWSSLDDALLDDGCLSLVGLAKRRIPYTKTSPFSLHCPTRTQRALDTAVLWHSKTGNCVHRNRLSLGDHPRDHHLILESQPLVRRPADSLFGVGFVRIGTELHALAIELAKRFATLPLAQTETAGTLLM